MKKTTETRRDVLTPDEFKKKTTETRRDVLTPDEFKPLLKTHAARVLALLSDLEPHSTTELKADGVGTHRFSASIKKLREQFYLIDTVRQDSGSFTYRLRSRRPSLKLRREHELFREHVAAVCAHVAMHMKESFSLVGAPDWTPYTEKMWKLLHEQRVMVRLTEKMRLKTLRTLRARPSTSA